MNRKSAAVIAIIGLVAAMAYLPSNFTLANSSAFSSTTPNAAVSASENFSIIVLPDTQGYVKNYPWIFDDQTQWIVDNKEALNIVFVTQLGDLVDQTENVTQWESANRSMSKLDGAVPWAVLPGNHDMFYGNITNYNTYFGYNRFSGESWYGGTYAAGDNANSYELFSAGGSDYLILHLQNDPSDDVLWWASNVISQYPQRRVIVSTHEYMMGFLKLGQRSDIGERIWHSLIRQHADQIFLALSGHSGAEDMITDTVNGHVVYQVLADFQNETNIKSGWLRILEFSPEKNAIQVKTYSPLLNQYKNGPQSEFTLQYDLTANTVPELPSTLGIALVLTAISLTVLGKKLPSSKRLANKMQFLPSKSAEIIRP